MTEPLPRRREIGEPRRSITSHAAPAPRRCRLRDGWLRLRIGALTGPAPAWRTTPENDNPGWPPGIPYIVGNEAAELFDAGVALSRRRSPGASGPEAVTQQRERLAAAVITARSALS